VSNVLGIIIGGLCVVAGFVLLISWWAMFIKMLMAVVPIIFILIGAGALLFFISEIKSRVGAGNEGTGAESKAEPK